MLILEYCEKGSLEALLPSINESDLEGKRSEFNDFMTSSNRITHLLRGVACGMHYLSDEGYIHKVLRAKNIFISGSFLPKISGFDERTFLEEEMELYLHSVAAQTMFDGHKLPPVFEDLSSWTPPETLLPPYNYSMFSDIWSFGCLIWECFSEGERPFGSFSASELSKMFAGPSWKSLSKPTSCPDALYELMSYCCSKEAPQTRPWFSQITSFLDNLIRSPSHHLTPRNAAGGNYQTISPAFQYANNFPNF